MDSYPRCSHLQAALQDNNLRVTITSKYKSSVAWSSNRSQHVKNPAKRRKVSAPECGTCRAALSRPFVCLQCNYAGCWAKNHAAHHLRDLGHLFCADPKTGAVFCLDCDDFVYEGSLDALYLITVVAREEKQTRFQTSKRGRDPFQPWSLTAQETAALENAITLPCQARRGLLNLGNTCYLNVILQAFVHNPLLRNYFLSDKHGYDLCERKDCACCEMDRLFAEVFSNSPLPFGPVTFLATTWRNSSNSGGGAELAGYAQQDAHEFFITTLNHIHTTSRGSTNISCICPIHSTFGGTLQSDVRCEKCGNVTGTPDPVLDVSLDLIKSNPGDKGSEDTLYACLRRFTQPEKLSSKDYNCEKCHSKTHDASKRLSFRTLPPVLSFQFKRFEHKGLDKSTARKIDTPVRFPAEINMAPFTTVHMNSKDREEDGKYFDPGPVGMYEYELFAVVNHEGQINNGHYTNYARFQDEWYHFNDDKVTPSSLKACLGSMAYMCFYVKKHLDYKPWAKPSYIAATEVAMVAEAEAARVKGGHA